MTATDEDQWEEIIAELAAPAFHGLSSGERVERIDTQLSVILLAGGRALKFARPVALSFCDFSTADKRRQALKAEFELNRPMAPELYLRLSEVTRGEDGLALDGEGAALEPCLVMRRFDQDARFDALLAEGGLDRRAMEDLAAAIHAFHQAQQADRRPGFGGAEGLKEVLANNRLEAERYPDILPPGALAQLHQGLEGALDQQAALLDARKQAGLVRHCHGDLHLGNIVRWEGRPLLFDAIAFNEQLAVIDIFYDLAFLLMDLEVGGHRPLAQAALSRYLDLAGGEEALALLPLFLALRAHIRAFVAAASSKAEDGETAAADARKAARYLEAAESFLAPAAPRLIALGGLSGSGKTSVARGLAPLLEPAPGAVILRSDVTRKRLAGLAPEERLPSEAYSKSASDAVYEALRTRAARALAAGHSVILDAVHAAPEERRLAEDLASEAGVPFAGLWLDAPPAEMKARVAARRGDASDATEEVVERQLAYELGEIAWRKVSAENGLEQTIAAARAALEL